MPLRVLVQPKLKKPLAQSISPRLGLLVTGGLKTGQNPPIQGGSGVDLQSKKAESKEKDS